MGKDAKVVRAKENEKEKTKEEEKDQGGDRNFS